MRKNPRRYEVIIFVLDVLTLTLVFLKLAGLSRLSWEITLMPLIAGIANRIGWFVVEWAMRDRHDDNNDEGRTDP